MRYILIFTLLLISFLGQAQDKYFTKSGFISFFSHSPMEDITAVNKQVAAFLDIETGEITFAALIKSFTFEKALMQEHFNENYMESDNYPKATFKGKILDYDKAALLSGQPYKVKVEGKLLIRGIEKDLTTDVELIKEGNFIKGETLFIAKPSDFDIKIPALVKDNIAKEIEVTVKTKFEPY